ncbi:hypothetical protein Y032_0081g1435 [Ancylostoma ceylanicum]|uniref:SCP domain-containing protein n=1 Tax=Ancylostoma ceylanicum TaxID=53326 RepID=A0A016TSG5_9BILA|nr:hypothetical protein Y032_0081g1435 [Ancylostoma ceylanicum]
MAANIRTLFWAILVLSCFSNVLPWGIIQLPMCSESEMHVTASIRSRIYKEITKYLPRSPSYSCDLEESAAIVIIRRITSHEEDGEEELSHRGPWRPSFIEDVIHWWSPILKSMERVKSVGCFYRAIKEEVKTGELSCAFEFKKSSWW